MSTITVTPTVELSNVPPRVRLNVADAGTPALTTVTVTRQNPDGSTTAVRTPDGNPLPMSSNAGLLYDYEMPYGAPVTYSSQETPANVSVSVTVDEQRLWLVHPGVPALSQPIELRAGSLAEESYPVTQGVFYPMGRQRPVVVSSGARHGLESSLTVVVDTAVQLQALRTLVADAGVLLFQVPPVFGLNVSTSYIAVSDVKSSRLSDIGNDPYRNFEMPFVTVDMPAGGSQSQRTFADLLVFPTLGSLMDRYSTFADLLAGP